jgi:hypothetical protein
MQPIFNRHGRTIGWLYNGIIYDRRNCYRAFIRDNHIFTYDAKHLGIMHNGIFRDKRGQYIAFMDEASSDPRLPIPEITPIPPIPSIPSVMPIPPRPSTVSLASSHWNPLKWEVFLDG